MKSSLKYSVVIILFLTNNITSGGQPVNKKVNLKDEFKKTLLLLSNTLLENQIKDSSDKNYGAIQCGHCNVLHTRAAEGMYPLFVCYEITNDKKYFNAAINLTKWLIAQQQQDGSWKETPEEWTGTTTDQLFMLVKSYLLEQKNLNVEQKSSWQKSIKKAADYLSKVMSPEFASINYCATTAASLSETNKLISDKQYSEKAYQLARRIISKMDKDGFIEGEGGRSFENKYGVDLGYDLEMSLWGLGVYAKNEKDKVVDSYVNEALKNHLYFIYPDGSMDNSWGIRSNKWTTYGSLTSDGCQFTFMLYADKNPEFKTAAYKNLLAIRNNISNGYLGYGPHYSILFNSTPCIYPTFVKAKNLAMAYNAAKDETEYLPEIPGEKTNWMKTFQTLDLNLVRTNNYMCTISSYRYKDYEKREKSKYMFRPSGGSICNLWVENYGYLEASSGTEYHRWEPMSFPEVGEITSITPRIEFTNANGYFTNLYEFDARQSSSKINGGFAVTASGELKNNKWQAGGVGYTITHTLTNGAIEKKIDVIFHDAAPEVKIVEPVILNDGAVIQEIDNKSFKVVSLKRTFLFQLTGDNSTLRIDKSNNSYWAPYPALKAVPVFVNVAKPKDDFKQQIKFKISIIK
jgi:hypothetical protein